MNKDFIKASAIRAIKTFAQTMLSMITVGQALSEVNWLTIFSVSIVAAICSILTSIITGLPEVDSDGELLFDQNEDGSPVVRLVANDIKDGMKVVVKDITEVK
jgi:hypothetical protein